MLCLWRNKLQFAVRRDLLSVCCCEIGCTKRFQLEVVGRILEKEAVLPSSTPNQVRPYLTSCRYKMCFLLSFAGYGCIYHVIIYDAWLNVMSIVFDELLMSIKLSAFSILRRVLSCQHQSHLKNEKKSLIFLILICYPLLSKPDRGLNGDSLAWEKTGTVYKNWFTETAQNRLIKKNSRKELGLLGRGLQSHEPTSSRVP